MPSITVFDLYETPQTKIFLKQIPYLLKLICNRAKSKILTCALKIFDGQQNDKLKEMLVI